MKNDDPIFKAASSVVADALVELETYPVELKKQLVQAK
jgi:hypothetical protein